MENDGKSIGFSPVLARKRLENDRVACFFGVSSSGSGSFFTSPVAAKPPSTLLAVEAWNMRIDPIQNHMIWVTRGLFHD